MQKTIYSLPALRQILEAANRRYLEFLSAIEDPRNGRDKLDRLSQPVQNEGPRAIYFWASRRMPRPSYFFGYSNLHGSNGP